jgi:uncharacterized protein YdhG (YjbR/CyaY superfamily)
MAKTDFESVDCYIAAQREAVQKVLELVRSTVRKALPGADEVISYQIPAYKLRGETVIYFAAWKKHYSLYPVTAHLVERFKDDLTPYELNDRGTLRFPLAQPVPVKLIARIAKLRAKEVAHREKVATPKKRSTRKETNVNQTDCAGPYCEPASPECSS